MSAYFRGGWSFKQKTRVITLWCGIKMYFRLITKHACDVQTELRSQDRASIAASRCNYIDWVRDTEGGIQCWQLAVSQWEGY